MDQHRHRRCRHPTFVSRSAFSITRRFLCISSCSSVTASGSTRSTSLHWIDSTHTPATHNHYKLSILSRSPLRVATRWRCRRRPQRHRSALNQVSETLSEPRKRCQWSSDEQLCERRREVLQQGRYGRLLQICGRVRASCMVPDPGQCLASPALLPLKHATADRPPVHSRKQPTSQVERALRVSDSLSVGLTHTLRVRDWSLRRIRRWSTTT